MIGKWGIYTFVAIAQDMGQPSLSSSLSVNIQVIDENLEAPKFLEPTPGALMRIQEVSV